MRNQPHVRQKDISDKFGITIQAVSKYFKKLVKEGLLEVGSERADYRLTPKAIEKLREDLKNFDEYTMRIKNDIKFEDIQLAMATQHIREGEKVGLIIKEGVLFAIAPDNPDMQACGTAATEASPGEEVGLKDIQGKLKLGKGKILIIKLPNIKEGGSRNVDLDKVKSLLDEFKPDRIAVMGAVARAVLNKLNKKANIEFGITTAVAIAASRGINVFVLAVGRMTGRITAEIDNINRKNSTDIIYEIRDVRKI
jgi:putative transcriptional regulator